MKMAPAQLRRVEGGAQKPHKAHRMASGSARSKQKSLHRESTPIRSNAFDEGPGYHADHDKDRSGKPGASTPRTSQDLSKLPTAPKGKMKGESQAEAYVVTPDHNASLLPPETQIILPRLNMDGLPTEVLQMIWGELISMPACHIFKLKRGDHPEEGIEWAIHLWPKGDSDTSAYRRWKQLLSLNNIGFQMVFRRFVKHLQPIRLRLPRGINGKNDAARLYKTRAAINEAQDLVILEMDRGHAWPWFEHTYLYSFAMDGNLIQERMRHFRRVAIHYKFGQIDCARGGVFMCFCHGANQPHDGYNACPLMLATFLDLFQNLEQFYFVVDSKLVWHNKFTTDYRDEVEKNRFRAKIDAPGGAKAVGKQFTLSRFFDTTYEYLQQAPHAYLEAMGRTGSADIVKDRTKRPPSPWVGAGSAHQCLVETLQFYKSQKGSKRFRQDLEKRQKVRFGILIPYSLQEMDKKGTT